MIAMYLSDFFTATCKLAFGLFCLWMFFDNIYHEKDPKERLIWSILMLILMPLLAPLYFLRTYLPRKRAAARVQRA